MIKERFFTDGRLYHDITSLYRRFGLMLYRGEYDPTLASTESLDDTAPLIGHYTKNFYYEKEYDADGRIVQDRLKKTINLTKMSSSFMRNLVMNEIDRDFGITIKNDTPIDEEEGIYKKKSWFQEVLKENNFLNQEGNTLEYALASGDYLRMPYIKSGKVKLSFVKPYKYEVVEHHNHIPKGVVLSTIKIDKSKKKKTYYTLLEYHRFLDEPTRMTVDGEEQVYQKGHHVWREIYKSQYRYHIDKIVNFKDMRYMFGLKEDDSYEYFNVDTPLFTYTLMPFGNNKDGDSPRGLGMTVNAIDTMHTINTAYDADHQETYDLRAMLLISDRLINNQIDDDGKLKKVFNPRTRVFVGVGAEEEMEPKLFAPQMRDVSYTNKIQRNLKIFNQEIKLDPSAITFEPQTMTTATQVKLDHKRTHDTREEICNVLEQSWEQLLWSIYRMAKMKKLINWEMKKEDIEVKIPDGVIVDDETVFNQDVTKLDKGIIAPSTFRKRYENMSEEESTIEQEKIDAEGTVEVDFDLGDET